MNGYLAAAFFLTVSINVFAYGGYMLAAYINAVLLLIVFGAAVKKILQGIWSHEKSGRFRREA